MLLSEAVAESFKALLSRKCFVALFGQGFVVACSEGLLQLALENLTGPAEAINLLFCVLPLVARSRRSLLDVLECSRDLRQVGVGGFVGDLFRKPTPNPTQMILGSLKHSDPQERTDRL